MPWPSQQPRTAFVSTTATPSRGGAQQQGRQQSQQSSWRVKDDLFEPATLARAGVMAPDSSERPPPPLPTAPSSINYGSRGDASQAPGSILRKRLADMTQSAGDPDPKRVRWA